MISRRRPRICLTAYAGLSAFGSIGKPAPAADYPTRAVRLVVGYPPAAPPTSSRGLIGQRLSEKLGQQFGIENSPARPATTSSPRASSTPSRMANTVLLGQPVRTTIKRLAGNANLEVHFRPDIAAGRRRSIACRTCMTVTRKRDGQACRRVPLPMRMPIGQVNMASPPGKRHLPVHLSGGTVSWR